jgi:hypothetical protein
MAAGPAARSLIEVRLLDRAALIRLLDSIPERGAGDEGTELQLVAAGQEDGTDLAQRFHKIRILCLRSTLRAQRNDSAGSERCEDAVVDLDHLNTQRGCRGNDRDPRVGAPVAATKGLEHCPPPKLGLSAADREQGAERRSGSLHVRRIRSTPPGDAENCVSVYGWTQPEMASSSALPITSRSGSTPVQSSMLIAPWLSSMPRPSRVLAPA